MENQGREDRKDNDLFFTCSLIDYMPERQKIRELESFSYWVRKGWKKYMI